MSPASGMRGAGEQTQKHVQPREDGLATAGWQGASREPWRSGQCLPHTLGPTSLITGMVLQGPQPENASQERPQGCG